MTVCRCAPSFRWLLLMLMLTVGMFAPAAEDDGQIADRVLRFVNDEVITEGDVWEEMRLRYLAMRRRGADLPRSEEELLQLRETALTELTDQRLLIQEADQLGIEIDKQSIRRQVREWIRQNNLPPTLIQEAEEQQRRIDQGRMHTVLRHYENQWPEITPQEVRTAYEKRKEEFRLPARAQGARLLIKAPNAEDQRRLLRDLMAALQQVQVDPSPAVAASISDDDLSQVVKTSDNERAEIIAALLNKALQAVPEDPPRKTARLQEQLQGVLERHAQWRDAASVDQQLRQWQQTLMAIADHDQRRQRFTELARSHSQGPRAGDGGVMDWSEPGDHGPQVDEFLFAAEPAAVSEPLAIGEFRGLLMVYQRQDAGVRSLRDVAAEIRAELEQQRLHTVRDELVAQLRRQGVVRDLAVEVRLPSEWFSDDPATVETAPPVGE